MKYVGVCFDQRLNYAQVELSGASVQRLSKRCPRQDPGTEDGRLHDLLEHEHEYPHRTGHVVWSIDGAAGWAYR